MQPMLCAIGGYKIYAYGTAMVAAFLVCFTLAYLSLPKDWLRTGDLYNFCLLTMVSLLFAGKIAGVLLYGPHDSHGLGYVLKFWQRGSFSFVPSFLTALALIALYCKRKRLPPLKVVDYLLPFAVLGAGMQRVLGCFMAGCCHGTPTTLPWGTVFAPTSRAGLAFPGLALHPTQLYYGAASLAVYLLLQKFKQSPRGPGEITGLGLATLSSAYFLITFLRGDIPGDRVYLNLVPSQYLALVMFTGGAVLLLRPRSRGRCETLRRNCE